MAKTFNVTAVCIPEKHYMVNIEGRLKEIKALIEEGYYFTINRARQYGKTTTLMALERYLQEEYDVISLDFQMFGSAEFKDETTFALSFASSFFRCLKKNIKEKTTMLENAMEVMKQSIDDRNEAYGLRSFFEELEDICKASEKPLVLMIDEVDSATNNQVFLDFLAQLRACYIRRAIQPSFQSVILAGVYDVRNLRRKLRPEEEHKVNSPWNIAVDFSVDMSFSTEDIAEKYPV